MPVENMFTKVYCQPVGNDVSPMILEKAFAQVYGNYEVIVLGHASDALRDLTGAPTAYIDLKDKTIMEAQIMQAFEKKYPLVIASKQVARNQSISMKHSYNVLDVKKHMNELFLKLRDPRGWTKAEFNSPKQFQC